MSLATPAVISAWSTVCSFGVGSGPFTDGIRSGRSAVTSLDPDEWASPVSRAYLVPGGSPADLLGRKGTRAMDRATGLAVAAVGQLLHDGSGVLAQDTSVVLGTSTGSVSSIMRFTRDSLTQPKPYFVDPARFPNTVMNRASGQVAIWYGLRGANVTIAGGRASALLALNHAVRMQHSGRAGSVVCGAVEEFSAERAWLDWHTGSRDESVSPLGEGAAVLLLADPAEEAHDVLAEVLAIEVALAEDDGQVAPLLADCVRRAFAEAEISPLDLWAVACSDPPGPRGVGERRAVRELLGEHDARRLSCVELLGDTNSASAAFQIAALLSVARDAPAAVGRTALVTAVDDDGVVGCALLRTHGESARS